VKNRKSTKSANSTALAKPPKISTMNGLVNTENENCAAHVSGEHASGVREISIAPAGRKAAQLRAITLQGKPSCPAPLPPGGKAIPEGSLQKMSERHEAASGDQRRAGAPKADRVMWFPSAQGSSPTTLGKETQAAGTGIKQKSRPGSLGLLTAPPSAAPDHTAPADPTGRERAEDAQDEALYPFTDARHVCQYDLYDAGMPPFARAPLHPKNVAITIVVSVLSVKNIPQADLVGNCDALVQVRHGKGIFRTAVKHNVKECEWSNEDFQFCFANTVAQKLFDCDPAEGSHKFVCFTLMDDDRIRFEELGYASIDMLQILSVDEEGKYLTLPLHKQGKDVVDTSGRQTTIQVRIRRGSQSESAWTSPSLGASAKLLILRIE
jgi:hypothetical protein